MNEINKTIQQQYGDGIQDQIINSGLLIDRLRRTHATFTPLSFRVRTKNKIKRNFNFFRHWLVLKIDKNAYYESDV